MTDQREAVAAAIFEASTFYGDWDRQPEANREVCFNMADAAIEHLTAERDALRECYRAREAITKTGLFYASDAMLRREREAHAALAKLRGKG